MIEEKWQPSSPGSHQFGQFPFSSIPAISFAFIDYKPRYIFFQKGLSRFQAYFTGLKGWCFEVGGKINQAIIQDNTFSPRLNLPRLRPC